LKTLETDGTFDQESPLDLLFKEESPHKFSCFDLSAATDRLPLQFQAQVLTLCGVDSLAWSRIISLP